MPNQFIHESLPLKDKITEHACRLVCPVCKSEHNTVLDTRSAAGEFVVGYRCMLGHIWGISIEYDDSLLTVSAGYPVTKYQAETWQEFFDFYEPDFIDYSGQTLLPPDNDQLLKVLQALFDSGMLKGAHKAQIGVAKFTLSDGIQNLSPKQLWILGHYLLPPYASEVCPVCQADDLTDRISVYSLGKCESCYAADMS